MVPAATLIAMHQHRSLLVFPVVIAMTRSACASSPELDWEAAQSQANAFTEASSTNASFLGAGSLHAMQDPPAAFGEGGATLSYPSGVRVDEISVACFGDGEARFGVTVRTGSSWTGSDSITLACDNEVHTLPLSTPLESVNAISLNGTVEKGAGAVIAAVITGTAEQS
ncbi:hypothetical protein JF66_15720 [Cryobacterium sp. MLB-32]|nr:hypothetical protein JF66_15720 [Cryobacterium sp. MLB-32]